MSPHKMLMAAAAAATLIASPWAIADTKTVIETVPRGSVDTRPLPGGAYEHGKDVKVDQWTEDGKLKQEIHYGDGCRKSVQKDLVTGEEKVVLHEGCAADGD